MTYIGSGLPVEDQLMDQGVAIVFRTYGERESISSIVPDIANAQPVRFSRISPRLSYKQRVLRTFYTGLLILAGNGHIAAPTVSAQTGPDQSNEQVVDPNQFTDPLVAGVLAEAEADIPPEDALGLDHPPVDPDAVISTPDTRPCSIWPQEMAEMRKNLSTLEGICLARYTDRSQIPYLDIRDLLLQDGWGNADWERRMLHLLASDEVYKQRGVLVVGHEYFHLHQVKTVQDNGLKPPWQESYFNTAEGREFVNSLDAVITNGRSSNTDITANFPQWGKWLGDEFVAGGNYYENAAHLASIWYNYPSWIDSDVWALLRNFATKWWPKESALPSQSQPTGIAG